jgi:hexokinase
MKSKINLIDYGKLLFSHSTPCLAAIREDDSPDLREVGRVLEQHLKVGSSSYEILFCICMGFRWSFLLSAASDILISFLPTQQIQDVPLKNRKLVRIISDIITKRAARLAAAGIVAVLQKIGRDGTLCDTYKVRKIREGEPKRSAVAIEGGLYQGYSVFREYLNEALVEILGDEIAPTVTLLVMEDGSGMGGGTPCSVILID